MNTVANWSELYFNCLGYSVISDRKATNVVDNDFYISFKNVTDICGNNGLWL